MLFVFIILINLLEFIRFCFLFLGIIRCLIEIIQGQNQSSYILLEFVILFIMILFLISFFFRLLNYDDLINIINFTCLSLLSGLLFQFIMLFYKFLIYDFSFRIWIAISVFYLARLWKYLHQIHHRNLLLQFLFFYYLIP